MPGEPILVVDDNPLNLKLTRLVLTGEGYEVHEAQDSREALEALERVHPRLILMDIQMPGVDGLELARRLKSNPATRDVPILALTACAMRGDEQRAYQAGCDGYISKPIDTRQMPEVIRSYLETPST
jgi:two-component system cell cycle response regulator DivK